jgi:hypothetical protein
VGELTSTTTVLGDEATALGSVIEPLRSEFRKEILPPDDDGYDTVRAVWNGTIDRRPAVVLPATGTADVIGTAPSGLSTIDLWLLGGAVGDRAPDEDAANVEWCPSAATPSSD